MIFLASPVIGRFHAVVLFLVILSAVNCTIPSSLGPQSTGYTSNQPPPSSLGGGFNPFNENNSTGPKQNGLSNSTSGISNNLAVELLKKLESILNTTIDSLPGLKDYAQEIKQLVSQQTEDLDKMATYQTGFSPGQSEKAISATNISGSIETNKTKTYGKEVALKGKLANGSSCDTEGYLTLSATSLSTLSGFFSVVQEYSSSVNQKGTEVNVTMVQKIQAQISYCMVSVVKITITPMVSQCVVPPSETVFSSEIRSNMTLIGEMIKSLRINQQGVSLNQTAGLGIEANSTLTDSYGRTIGLPNTNLPQKKDCKNGYKNKPGFFDQNGNLTNITGTGPAMIRDPTTGQVINSTGLKSHFWDDKGNPVNVTATDSDAECLPEENQEKNPADIASSTQLEKIQKSYEAAKVTTVGLRTSKPSEGPQGVHLGHSKEESINVNVKSVININNYYIDYFITNTNGGTAAYDGNGRSFNNGGDSGGGNYPGSGQSGGSNYPGSGQSGSEQSGGGNYPGSGQTGGSNYPGSGQNGDSNYPGSGQTGGSNYPGSGQTGGGNYPGSEQSGGGNYPGSGQSGGSNYPGSGQTGGGNYPGSEQSGGGNYPGGIQNTTYPDGGNPGKSDNSSDPGGGGGYPSSPGSEGGIKNPPESSGGDKYPTGGGPGGGGSNQCQCPPNHETELKIRSLASQIESVHRVMRKRGITDL
ncbi:expressed protein [Phakopsora pachyrhizi]|uniref:Expressed protein n=1 Tax=Phakopsora pachyrhizi TaxID=170000 RepID=A0AAV0B0C3_PHAPC|nr:expressed protein [Phakopsora pachyrhizi]